MTDKEILKALGLSKKSCLSEQIVQTTHHWLDACDKIAELEKENAELKEEIKNNEDLATVAYMQGAEQQKRKSKVQLVKARELILKLYNAGRDVLMCRAEEKAYDNFSEVINDRSIEKFLSEVQ